MPSICSHGPVLHTVVSKFDARRSWVQILRTSSSQGRRRARKVTGVEYQLREMSAWFFQLLIMLPSAQRAGCSHARVWEELSFPELKSLLRVMHSVGDRPDQRPHVFPLGLLTPTLEC